MTRRAFLKGVGVVSGAIFLPQATLAATGSRTLNRLEIPERLDGIRSANGLSYVLRAQTGSKEFVSGLNTPTLGINRDYLGPTLFLRRGDDVQFNVTNALAEPTTLHWHGLHVPAKADGGPAQIIKPGATWAPQFTVNQPAGTFWYHSHLLHKTGEQVYRGLTGMIVLEDEVSDALALPKDYGIDDIPLTVQDRRFNSDGSFDYIGMHRDVMTGLFGDHILVNGTLNPVFTPTTQRVRFRLLNAANARTLTFAFDDQRDFQLIATDGGFVERPVTCTSLVLAPSERAEIVVDFADSKPCTLISLPLESGSPFATTGMMARMHTGNNERFDILRIEPSATVSSSPALPSTLATIPRLDPADAITTRRLTLSMAMGMGMMRGRGRGESFFINDQAMDMNVINYRVKKDTTEIWEIHNDSMMMHPFHIHHSQFQILDRDGVPPAAHEAGLKDTVKVGPGETVRFIMRFENYSDPNTAYMYHCHILEHEDNGMMGQFTVE
ncbi:MAG: multicopper oxidase domain-containing protein [Gammaproteobacteria bacterium]|jgi:FtsP/CotA-like multicopper oxidase with cupredoxin domain|nr:multicopper oxidase domain-containing protein [Gammaproteobacteria bacterium]